MVDHKKSHVTGWGARLKKWGNHVLGIFTEVSLVLAIALVALLITIIVRAIAT